MRRELDLPPEALPEQYQKFVEALGVEATLELCRVFAGEEIYIPTREAAERVARNAEIVRRRKGGESVKSLCMRYGLKRRTIYEIIKKQK